MTHPYPTLDIGNAVHPSWLPHLASCREDLLRIEVELQQQCAQSGIGSDEVFRERIESGGEVPFLPAPSDILAAFRLPFDKVRVLLVGQDPYPTPGNAVGLSFSVSPTTPLPQSLKNIYAELETDLGIAPANHGDLRHWANQGVCLLNEFLTVAPGAPMSHRKLGWERITRRVVSALAFRTDNKGQPIPLVAILWGKPAGKMAQYLHPDTVIIESAHPSPLSARRGFFGSRPFSRTNEALEAAGLPPIDWQLPKQQ